MPLAILSIRKEGTSFLRNSGLSVGLLSMKAKERPLQAPLLEYCIKLLIIADCRE